MDQDFILNAILPRKLENNQMILNLISRQRLSSQVGVATKDNMEILVLGSK